MKENNLTKQEKELAIELSNEVYAHFFGKPTMMEYTRGMSHTERRRVVRDVIEVVTQGENLSVEFLDYMVDVTVMFVTTGTDKTYLTDMIICVSENPTKILN